MILIGHPEDQMRMLAWYGIAVVASYFFLASFVLRWHRRRDVRVAQYDPPTGISPAVAAYLWECGVSDKPFVAALLNMASKGWLKIEQGPADYLLSRGNASVKLFDEEQVIAEQIFCGTTSVHEVNGVLISTINPKADSVRLSQLFSLARMARNVRDILESAVEPDLISRHFACFVPGIALSLWCLLAALYPEIDGLRNSQAGGLVIASAVFVVWGFLATAKTLPATMYKLKSHLPGRTPRPLPLVKRDGQVMIPLVMTLAALAAVAWISSVTFALQGGTLLVVNLAGAFALRAPTAAGHALLAKLDDFRMFLAQVDSDRVNRMNAPTATSPSSEKYWAWALALDVEHAWGEQFAAAVLNLLAVADMEAKGPARGPEQSRAAAEIMDLHLR